ncbi:hypothetical protein ACHAWO_003302 [Cyclotella atomus]|uniref:Uncharacterized protein n=1 Tax=Cyclotella atomus TaxID=382360 RepID=A0ABD3NXY4_9STRA
MLSSLRSIPLNLASRSTSRPAPSCLSSKAILAPQRWSSSGSGADKETVTKADLVQILSKEYEMTAAQSARVLDTVLDTIVEAVSKSHTVSIGNFGKFEAVTSPARMYNNPITKTPVWKEETRRVKFRPFNNFKECVNKKSG